MRHKIKKIIFILLFILLFDLLFFLPFFYPHQKTLITPEFGGGDSVVVYLPYKYFLCKNIKNFSLPFWSKNLSFGFPLLAEGEIGAFNPINIVTCLLFNYKTAFNISILIHVLISQIGSILLLSEIGLSLYSSLYLSVLLPFLPVVLMNYMQITLPITLYIFPLMLYFLIRIIKKVSPLNLLLFSLSISFQFLISHHQIFFITFIFLLLFLLIYLWFKKEKKILKYLLLFFISYFFGLLLVSFQLIPSLEFFYNSNRSLVRTFSYAVKFDQNLSLTNLFSLFYPYLSGKPQIGTYNFVNNPHPWEGTFFIYYLPLFLLIFLFLGKRKKHRIYIKTFFIVLMVIILFALGRNSPLYLVHYLPLFSSFRFPSRFTLMVVSILAILSAFGLEYFLKLIKSKFIKRTIFILIIIILFIEGYNFNYNFHVLRRSNNVFLKNKPLVILPKENLRMLTPFIDTDYLDQKYEEKGYLKNKNQYYSSANNLLLGNTSLIYNIQSLNNKVGPQLRRSSYLYGLISNIKVDSDKLIASFPLETEKLLKLTGISNILTIYNFDNKSLDLIKKIKIKNSYSSVNLYKVKNSLNRINFFTKAKIINSTEDFENQIKNLDLGYYVLLENKDLYKKISPGKLISDYRIIKNKDRQLIIETKTNINSILVLLDNFYPGWKVYIDGKESKIYRANLMYRGIFLPKGNHFVEFRYIPSSFYLGMKISIIAGILFIFYLKVCSRFL